MKWTLKGLCEYESYILDVCLLRHDQHFHYPPTEAITADINVCLPEN